MRNIKWSAWLILLSCMLAPTTTLIAENGKGVSITGVLTLPDFGTNCDRVEVHLEQPNGISFRQTYTDWLCNFSFIGLDPGTYYLHIAIPGYVDVHETVHVDSTLNAPLTIGVSRATDRTTDSRVSGSPIVDASEILRLQPEEAVRFYKESIESRKKGKSEDAMRQLEKAVRIAPEFYAAHNDLGLIYESAGRFKEAANQLWAAHEINSSNAAPLVNLGALCLMTGDLEEAERVSNMAVETDSQSALGFFNLGMALYGKSELQRAEAAFLKSLSLAPSMLVTRLPLANIYVRLGELANASKELDLFLEKAPESLQRSEAERLREGIHEILRQQAN